MARPTTVYEIIARQNAALAILARHLREFERGIFGATYGLYWEHFCPDERVNADADVE